MGSMEKDWRACGPMPATCSAESITHQECLIGIVGLRVGKERVKEKEKEQEEKGGGAETHGSVAETQVAPACG